MNPPDALPAFRSMAFCDIPHPDYAEMTIMTLPPGASSDPAVWAKSIFSIRTMPRWVVAALAIRQLVSPLIGVPRAGRDVFDVTELSGDEALMAVDDKHLDFRCAVGVDAQRRLVRVTTVVRLKGWSGRLYFAPVRLAHPVVVRSMLKRSRKLLAAQLVAW